METRTYRVQTMPDAIRRIRADLGSAASILHVRRLDGPWWMKWSASRWEVVATKDSKIQRRFNIDTKIKMALDIESGKAAADA